MLTDTECKNAICAGDKARVRLTDGGGLYLEVATNGSKRWFWKYLFSGKEKRLALGSYPDVSLKAARSARDDARKQQQAGTDPAQQRRLDKLKRKVSAESTFEIVAREFHSAKVSGWSQHYGKRWLERLEKDVFPWLGSLPIDQITAPLLLQTLRRVEGRGVRELAHTLLEGSSQVLRYGVATGRCERNAAADLRGALKPVATKHMAAVLEPKQAGELMRSIHGYAGQPATRAALLLSALLFQRPGNIRQMEWAEIDFEAEMWSIPAQKMKRTQHGKVNGRPHLVPLAKQAMDILREIQPLTGHSPYVFPSLTSRTRPMSDNTVRVALRRMGYDNDTMTPHGFRAMARTLLVERANVPPDVIEAQLAHAKSGPLGSAYDRAEFMEQRRRMMTTWADYLDQLQLQRAVPELQRLAPSASAANMTPMRDPQPGFLDGRFVA
ncbi:tyrosine-type recombinase/integrase [Variovorax sp.]|jgi:integrase|uniref:tyrosine-type recombinase/integrase n=1 Tax=Variovorax sp. TaxID=1871043 RepID=UPI0037D9FECA